MGAASRPHTLKSASLLSPDRCRNGTASLPPTLPSLSTSAIRYQLSNRSISVRTSAMLTKPGDLQKADHSLIAAPPEDTVVLTKHTAGAAAGCAFVPRAVLEAATGAPALRKTGGGGAVRKSTNGARRREHACQDCDPRATAPMYKYSCLKCVQSDDATWPHQPMQWGLQQRTYAWLLMALDGRERDKEPLEKQCPFIGSVKGCRSEIAPARDPTLLGRPYYIIASLTFICTPRHGDRDSVEHGSGHRGRHGGRVEEHSFACRVRGQDGEQPAPCFPSLDAGYGGMLLQACAGRWGMPHGIWTPSISILALR